jgi:hypothetical protein
MGRVVVVEVDVELGGVVVDVVVDTLTAVVTGVVVGGTVGGVVVVAMATSDDVDSELVVATPSLLHPANVRTTTATGTRCVSFTAEVWHARRRLPDQCVGFVASFNKM